MRKTKLVFLSLLLIALSGTTGLSTASAQQSKAKYERVINAQPLTTILKQLEETFSKKIIFSYEDLASFRVNGKISANSVDDALKQALVGLPVTYTVNGNYITVKATKASRKPAGDDVVVVSGKVIDEKGEPIPAATIKLADDGSVGTITDINGDFVLELTKGKGVTLDVSFLGMKSSA